jgi:predicted metalloprotease with PDZ domain
MKNFGNTSACHLLVLRSGLFACFCGSALADPSLPPDLVSGLASPEYQKREASEAAIFTWSKIKPEFAKEELFKLSQSAEDPEARVRCLAVLKALVFDDYAREGEGYIGISLMDDTSLVPGDEKLRSVIRVLGTMPDTAAANAGIQQNDLIVGLEKEVWHDVKASEWFMKQIRSLKPHQKVNLKILRAGNLVDVTVILSRRPVMADLNWFQGQAVDFQAAERTAMENYFRRWLSNRKARN